METQPDAELVVLVAMGSGHPGQGSPAGLANIARSTIVGALKRLKVPADQLGSCIDSIVALSDSLRAALAKRSPSVVADSLEFEIGISADGKVGILGTGSALEVAAKVRIVVKMPVADGPDKPALRRNSRGQPA